METSDTPLYLNVSALLLIIDNYVSRGWIDFSLCPEDARILEWH